LGPTSSSLATRPVGVVASRLNRSDNVVVERDNVKLCFLTSLDALAKLCWLSIVPVYVERGLRLGNGSLIGSGRPSLFVLLDKRLYFVDALCPFDTLVASLLFVLIKVHELIVVVALSLKFSFNARILLLFVKTILTAVVA